MRSRIGAAAGVLALAALLAACSKGGAPLMNLHNDGKPDEFAILPTKPLQPPPNYAELPQPAPGGSNLTDPTPMGDAVAALGGRPAALEQGPSGADGALLARASRYGNDPAIRAELAQADADFRSTKSPRLLERLFAVSVYMRVYDFMALDQYAELARWRAAGVRTPAAPPKGVKVERPAPLPGTH